MSQNAKLIIERIKRNLNVKNDKDLCLMLDIKQNTLSTWKKRDTLDFNKIISFCEINNLDLNEIFFPEDGSVEINEAEVGHNVHTEEKSEIQQFEIQKIKQVNLVNTNKEISFFKVQNGVKEETAHKILIGQRTQLKKIKVNSDVILVLNNKKVSFERIRAFSPDFSQVFFDTAFPQSTLNFVFTTEIKQCYINIGYLEDPGLKPDRRDENDKLNQILLLEKQIERLKKKFK